MIHIPDSIYPKDSNGQSVCPKCRKLINLCDCPSFEPAKPKQVAFVPSVRLEKSGRKGKIVTMVEGLPRNEGYLKNLAKDLKTRTGSGGTFYFSERGGVVEIQGDHQQVIKQILKKDKS